VYGHCGRSFVKSVLIDFSLLSASMILVIQINGNVKRGKQRGKQKRETKEMKVK